MSGSVSTCASPGKRSENPLFFPLSQQNATRIKSHYSKRSRDRRRNRACPDIAFLP
jgi:hypothetical protein